MNGGADNKTDCIDVLKNICLGISPQVHAAFISSFVAGMITHLYMITNKIPNWDDISCYNFPGQTDGVGRWFLTYINRLSTVFSNPAIHGIFAILFFSVAVAIIVASLKIRTVTGAVLIGTIMITFPSVTSMMMFMFTVNCYAFAAAMAALSAFIVIRYGWKGSAFSVILLVLSTATYQMFFLFAVCILLTELIVSMFRDDSDLKCYLKKGIMYLIVLVISLIVYVASVKLGPWQLSEYRGFSDMGNISLSNIPVLVMRDIHRLLQFFVTEPPSYVHTFFRVMNISAVIMAAAFSLILLVKNVHMISKKILAVVLMMLLVISAGGIYLLAPATDNASTIMIYPYIFLYIYVIAASEYVTIPKNIIVSSAICIVVASISYSGFLIANGAYYRNKLAFDRVTAFYNRIMVKVEAQEGYTYDQKLLIAGDYWPDPNILSACNLDGDDYEDMEGVAIENGLFTSGIRYNFLKLYLGIQGEEVEDDEIDKVESSDEFKSMPSYPSDGCVKKIDDVWVVKINDIK